jgi:hypothetical protein
MYNETRGLVNKAVMFEGIHVKYLILFFLLSVSAHADDYIFPNGKKGNVEKYKKICLVQEPASHKAMFYKSELCTYGAKGCEIGEVIEPFEVLCDLDYVSKCYSQKTWLTRNQYFKLGNDVVVSNISHSVTIKNSIKTSTICAHYK